MTPVSMFSGTKTIDNGERGASGSTDLPGVLPDVGEYQARGMVKGKLERADFQSFVSNLS